MKITQAIKTGAAMLFSIGFLFSQTAPAVFDAHNGIEDETDGGVNIGFYTAGVNQVILRSTFSFQRATVALEIPVDYAFTGNGDMLAVPPSFSAGYRLLDYGNDLLQVFGGFSTRAMGTYDLDIHMLIQPHSNFSLMATAGSANEIIERIESDSLSLYKISSNPEFALGIKIKGSGFLDGWFGFLHLANLNEFESIEGGTMDRDRISYLSIGKNYDDKLQFEIRAREDGRQLKLSYLLN